MNAIIRRNRKSIVIAVWGNSGSGKTTFSCALARSLTKKSHQSSIILSPDMDTPMLPVILPNVVSTREDSLGIVTDASEADSGIIAGAIRYTGAFPNIGVVGYAPNDNDMLYADVSPKKALNMINGIANLASDGADYLIVDCPCSMQNPFTRSAVEAADVVISMITPDELGLSYYKSNIVRFAGEDLYQKDHIWISVLSPVRPYHAVSCFRTVFQTNEYWQFPWLKDLQKCLIEGTLFRSPGYFLRPHVRCIRAVEDAVAEIGRRKHLKHADMSAPASGTRSPEDNGKTEDRKKEEETGA